MTVTLGIDLGTSSCKGVLFDAADGVLVSAVAAYPTHRPVWGYTEQNPADWLNAVTKVCRTLAEHPRWDHVAAIGLSGQMHTAVLIDDGGEPVRPAIVWQDVRSQTVLNGLSAAQRDLIRQITHNPAHTIMTLSSLLWLQEHEIESVRRARHLLLPKDYIRYWLTGAIGTDHSDASGAGLYDAETSDWSQTLSDAFGLPHHILPTVLFSDALHGNLAADPAGWIALSAGIPVVVGAADLAAEAHSAGLQNGEILIRTGTAGALVTRSAQPKTGGFHCYAGTQARKTGGDWLLVAGTHSCGSAVDWVRQNLLGGCDFSAFFSAARRSEPGARGMLFIPHLLGERAPYFDEGLRGSLQGLAMSHTGDDIARAAVEGVAFSLLDAKQVLPANEDGEVIKLIGGRGQHHFWGQLLSDVFARRILWLPQAGPAQGAALLAAAAMGACSAEMAPSQVFEPHADKTITYQRAFRRYQETIHVLAA